MFIQRLDELKTKPNNKKNKFVAFGENPLQNHHFRHLCSGQITG